MQKVKSGDIDIDFADRNHALSFVQHIPAAMKDTSGQVVRHRTGVYFTDIPLDPFTGQASIDYKAAEERGYFKVDFLNLNVYQQVKDEADLIELMKDPDWSNLNDRAFVEKVIHIGNHYDTMTKMPEPVDSIPRLAMFLAVIRPAKRYLIGQPWKEVAKTIWDKVDGEYAFKQSHSISYSQLVVVHMNLLSRQLEDV